MQPASEEVRKKFTTSLIRWFDKNQRALPWRKEPRDPYHVLVSELMLQQTQVATVVPYFERWISAFPTLQDLAKAPLEKVMKHWAGLGYYNRARYLHEAACQIVTAHSGKFPRSKESLLELPGIGPYTAGAISSMALSQREPLVDGNVGRVLSRVTALKENIKDPGVIKKLWQIADSFLPDKQPGKFNEALMELGALICIPENPKCLICPVRTCCSAFEQKMTHQLPIISKRPEITRIQRITLLSRDHHHRIAMRRRGPGSAHTSHFWEFPYMDLTGKRISQTSIQELTGASCRKSALEFSHPFTRYRIEVQLWECALMKPLKGEEWTWFSIDEIAELALTSPNQKILRWLKNGSNLT